MAPIAILTPMPIEAKPIKALIKNAEVKVIKGIKYTFGYIGNTRVSLTVTGIGKVSIAAMTARAIDDLQPRLIVLAGIAGGINPSLKLGDIVLGKNAYAVEHVDESYQVVYQPLTKEKIPHNYSLSVPNMALFSKLKNFQIINGTIATTDIFPQQISMIKDLHDKQIDAIEMEGSAFAQVCWMFKKPCTIIRGISDDATESLDGYKLTKSDESLTSIKLATNHVAEVIKHMYHSEVSH